MAFQIEDGFKNIPGANYKRMEITHENAGIAEKEGKSTVFVCSVNTINTVFGGAILTLPYTMLQCGLILGTGSFLLSFLIGLICAKLLLELKESTGYSCYASIAFECIGRGGLILTNILISIMCLGVPVIFIVVFADAATPLIEEIFKVQYSYTREFVIALNAIVVSWFCFSREVHNLRIASYTSISCVCLFCYVIFHILLTHWEELDTNLSDHLSSKGNGFGLTIPNIILAFGFHPCFFPIYNSLKPNLKNSTNGMKFATIAFIFTFIVYISVCCCALLIFGDGMKSDILKNISLTNYEYSRFILVVYLVISLMHMPMVFFSGKEAFINLYIELRYQKISNYCQKIRSDSELRAQLIEMEHKSKCFVKEMRNIEYYFLTTIVFATTFATAYMVTDLGQISAFLGSSASFLTCFFMPAGFYLVLCPNKPWLKYVSWWIIAMSAAFITYLGYECVKILI
ncbi:unnamed protein product [Moneuplotes crassus]|uniref:Amino acid transporter transmembrane domain-containing protein n=1 Tax=Euplotes crassus TaxID=5936 RepID=A0AAD1XF04_EUPCR|nr:unnamed protein product [Moneuplotes crassus]